MSSLRTRSRSRSVRPDSNGYAANAPALLANGVNGSSKHALKPQSVEVPAAAAHSTEQSFPAAVLHPAAASPSASPVAEQQQQLQQPAPNTLASLKQILKYDGTGVGRKDATRQSSDAEFFWQVHTNSWDGLLLGHVLYEGRVLTLPRACLLLTVVVPRCDGEPTLRKVAAHLDTLTSSEVQLRAAHSSLAQSFSSMNDTMSALLDSNTRLRRELRAQKLASQRRMLYGGGFLLVACTFGWEALRMLAVALVWTMEHPTQAWPVLLMNISVWTWWLWLLAPLLTLALFVHSMMNSYSHGRMTLGRTLAALAAGVAMQVPLLYFLTNVGVRGLATIQAHPIFDEEHAWANQGVTLALWALVALLDYTLLVLHGYMH